MKNDLISRQALCEYALNQKDKSITPNDIMRFPSAQPETHEERTETHGVCLDVIDRQATLDWLKNEWNGMITSLFDGIKALPSAQPIIRCKECVHADNFYHCDYMTTWHDGECFCSHGKRRTDD